MKGHKAVERRGRGRRMEAAVAASSPEGDGVSDTRFASAKGAPPHHLTGGAIDTADGDDEQRPVGVVLAGIDTLVVGWAVLRYLFTDEDKARLIEAKSKAGEKQFGREGFPVVWFGHAFNMSPKGTKGYEWVMENVDLSVCIAVEAQGGKVYPELYVTFRSAYLWRHGYLKAFATARGWLAEWAELGVEKVSRVDLCVDVALALPKIDLKRELLCLGRTRGAHSEEASIRVTKWTEGRRDTGYSIGRGDLLARIYAKEVEIFKTHKEWFEPLWKQNGWDGSSPVSRFEFQFRRQMLKELQSGSFQDMVAQMRDLWRYATRKWLTVREGTSDRNRSRWPLTDYWKTVQAAEVCFGMVTGISRVTQVQPEYEALMLLAGGALKTAIGLDLAVTNNEPLALSRARRRFDEWLADPEFLEEMRQRAARQRGMSDPMDGPTPGDHGRES